MIITRTPLRVSFFGGGTDYPAFFRREGGQVLAAAINKYLTVIVLELTEFFEYRIKVHYSRIESVRTVDEIQISVVREVLRYLDIGSGVEIYLAGQLPARTGLGSSSATTVGLLMALHAYRGTPIAPSDAALQAIYVEREMIKEPVGCQDQHVCASGNLARLRFNRDDTVEREIVALEPNRWRELESRLMLFYTGLQRSAATILADQVAKTDSGQLDEQLLRMRGQVDDAVAVLRSDGDIDEFGALLDEAWRLKRGLSSGITTTDIDEIYSRAREAGALGGKLLGAGAGGFLLLYTPFHKQRQVRQALSDLKEVPFAFERRGTRIIYDDD